MSGPDIFISYARADRKFASRFAGALAQEGFSVWWDAALHSGETFDEVIEAKLRAAKAIVVLWSPRSVISRWVRAEATLADRSNKLAPVIIEACDRPIIFELTHTSDLSHWDGDTTDGAWNMFVKDLHRQIRSREASGGGGGPREPDMRVPPAPSRPAPDEDYPRPPAPEGEYARRHAAPPPEDIPYRGFTPPQRDPEPAPAPTAAPPPPMPEPEPEEEYEATQFYTRGDGEDPFANEDRHVLALMEGDEMLMEFTVGPLGAKIGRSPPAEIVLKDRRVSRTHCTLSFEDGKMVLTDLQSTNGTFVDGERVEAPVALEDGARVLIGNCLLVYSVRSSADQSGQAAS
ncbi:TIR domain-containing protein [Sphingomicrobium nitratireducens]|uniref:TIR domain-containing protein n=1 Tax=Sphingomicrobium nitratireducens TaxID=2964666 RepID=UPI00223F52BD|nr:TIR domain-containing protein [Sphingomicrobium nitratireducens]